MARWRWAVVVVWVATLAVAGGLLAPKASTETIGGGFNVPGTGSYEAASILEEELGASTTDSVAVVFHSETFTVEDPEYQSEVGTATERLSGVERVQSVLTFFNTLDPRFRGDDGHTSIALVRMEGSEDEVTDTVPELRDAIEGITTIEHHITGLPAINYDTFTVSEEDLRRSELYTIPIVIVLLLIVFRTVISAAIPLVLGAASVVFAMAILFGVASVADTSIFALNVASMIGLGLGIDFSLIVVSRYRDELKRGLDPYQAVAVTMSTAGRSITYSAVTVVLSMGVLTLVLRDLMIVRSISMGVMLVAFTGLLAGMTLLPASLVLLGHRVEWLRIIPQRTKSEDDESGVWYRLSHAIMRRPWPYLGVTFALLLVVATPVRDLAMVGASTGVLPSDTESVIGSERLQEAFNDQRLTPVQVVMKTPEENGVWTPEFLLALDEFTETLDADPRTTRVDSLASELQFVPRDGRWQNFTPEELDPALEVPAPGAVPEIPGASVQPLIDVVVEENPLPPPTAPTFIALGRFTLDEGSDGAVSPTTSLNVVAVEQGQMTLTPQTPVGVLRTQNRGNFEAVETVTPGSPVTLEIGDQLMLLPGSAASIQGSNGLQFAALSLFVVRPGLDVQTSWLERDASLDAFAGMQREVIAGGVANQIPSGPLRLNADLVTGEPGAYFQHHLHPGPELIAVESGTFTIFASPEMTMTQANGETVEGEYDEPIELQAGGFALVQGFGIHRGRNLSDQPTSFYSVRVTDAEQPPFILSGVQENVAEFVNLEGGNDTALINVVANDDEYDPDHQQLVYDIRDEIVPNFPALEEQEVLVGGDAAGFLDFRDALYGRFPIVVITVAIMNFIILMMFFQSVVLPVKAIILNLIGILATIGVLVVIFQYGWLTSLLGFESQGLLNVVTPAILYVILFALSTDYEVFMLSRVKEKYEELGDNDEAVAVGLQQTAGIITAAGLILIGTFGSFASANVVTIKEIGLGLAIAVFIDSTIIRIIMVPATMRLMGDWNWWMPDWLRRIVPEIREAPAPEFAPAGVPASGMSWTVEPMLEPARADVDGPPSYHAPAPARVSQAQLRPTTDVLGIDIIPLSPNRPLTIGRDEANVVQLFDMRVSRFHARIERRGDAYVIVDLRSSNGIYVNGERIPPEPNVTQLRHGDLIEIGNMGLVTLAFEEIESIDRSRDRRAPAEYPGDE